MTQRKYSDCNKLNLDDDPYFTFGAEVETQVECTIQEGDVSIQRVYGEYFGDEYIIFNIILESLNGNCLLGDEKSTEITEEIPLPPAEPGDKRTFDKEFPISVNESNLTDDTIIAILQRQFFGDGQTNTAELNLEVELVPKNVEEEPNVDP